MKAMAAAIIIMAMAVVFGDDDDDDGYGNDDDDYDGGGDTYDPLHPMHWAFESYGSCVFGPDMVWPNKPNSFGPISRTLFGPISPIGWPNKPKQPARPIGPIGLTSPVHRMQWASSHTRRNMEPQPYTQLSTAGETATVTTVVDCQRDKQ